MLSFLSFLLFEFVLSEKISLIILLISSFEQPGKFSIVILFTQTCICLFECPNARALLHSIVFNFK